MKSAKKPQSRALGKGLSALFSESYSQIPAEEAPTAISEVPEKAPIEPVAPEATPTASQSEGHVYIMPLHKIQAGKYQPRDHFDEQSLRELSDSIRKNGLMQPILLRPLSGDAYEIIAGERRYRAAKMAGLDEIPVLIRLMEDGQALELALVENIQRQDLNPLEEAAGYQRLMDEFGYTADDLAYTVHKSRSHIGNLLRLLTLPKEVQLLLREEKLSMGHARALIGAHNVVELAHEVIRRGLNVRQTEHLARRVKDGRDAPRPHRTQQRMQRIMDGFTPESLYPAPASVVSIAPAVNMSTTPVAKDPDILALEDTLSENLGLKVSISDRGQAGEIMIAYDSLEQLDEILRRLGGSI